MEHLNKKTQLQFQEILLNLYNKGQEPNIEFKELMNEVKNQLISIMFNTIEKDDYT